MADDKLSIVNQALTAAGEDPLTALTPGSVMANAAIENYEPFVKEELENGTWKFASKTTDLSLLTAEADGTLKYRWQVPAAALSVQSILYRGVVLDGEFYEIEGQVVRAAYNTEISAKYVYRALEALWPQRFRRIIYQRLEALFLRVSERHTQAATRESDTEVRKAIARHTESRQRVNRPVGEGSLAQARMGRRTRRPF